MEKADVIFILTALVGTCVTFTSLLRLKKSTRLEREGSTAEGVVVEVDYNGIGSPTYHPVVRFWTPQQEWVTARSSFGNEAPCYQEGDQVQVRFDPSDPTNFKIAGEGTATRLILSAIMGGVIIVFALVVYLRS